MAPETPRPALTPRQQKILDAIRTEIEQKGYPPSMRQIGDMVGLASLSSVTHQLGDLRKWAIFAVTLNCREQLRCWTPQETPNNVPIPKRPKFRNCLPLKSATRIWCLSLW